jgi:hypothetical protein
MNANYIIKTFTNIIIKSSTMLTSRYTTLNWRLRKLNECLIWKCKTFTLICDCRLRIGEMTTKAINNKCHAFELGTVGTKGVFK